MAPRSRSTRLKTAISIVIGVAIGGGVLMARGVASGRRTPAAEATPSSVESPNPSGPAAPACGLPTLVGTVTAGRVIAQSAPSPSASAIASFSKINPQGAPQVFDLESSVEGPDGDQWYRALLPVRPNGTSGYVPATSLSVAEDPYRIVVDRERLTLTLWKGCSVVRTFAIGLGKESTPTPNGRFYIISLLKPPLAGSVYGSYAYGLSAYSNAITNWTGGGVIGIHGTNDPSSIGNRKSHGCIRMRNEDIDVLVPLLPLGTPVEIE